MYLLIIFITGIKYIYVTYPSSSEFPYIIKFVEIWYPCSTHPYPLLLSRLLSYNTQFQQLIYSKFTNFLNNCYYYRVKSLAQGMPYYSIMELLFVHNTNTDSTNLKCLGQVTLSKPQAINCPLSCKLYSMCKCLYIDLVSNLKRVRFKTVIVTN